jgi:hypothetical protein
VIKGFADRNKYDLTETYAPVARLTDVRLMFSIANKCDLDIHQMDVTTAFLNGDLEKQVYMEIPEGVENYENLRSKFVCKLEKALYGLKVSPKRWFEKFRNTMIKIGFVGYEFQPCIFQWRKSEKFVLVLLYVDDILIVGNSKERITQLKLSSAKEFEMTDMGHPDKFLGIEIIRDDLKNVMYLSQKKFIEKMLKRFDMYDCRPVATPMVVNESGETIEKRVKLNLKEIPYRQAIGCLLYLANATRPDICFCGKFAK